MLVLIFLDKKRRNDSKIFHTNAKQIASDSDINEAFKSIQLSIIKKVESYTCIEQLSQLLLLFNKIWKEYRSIYNNQIMKKILTYVNSDII